MYVLLLGLCGEKTWIFSKQIQFSSVQSLSHVQLLVTPWTAARQASLHHQLPELDQTHVHGVSDAIQPSHPLLSPYPPAPNPSQHQSFPMSQLFIWGGQSTGVSALASFLPKKSQGWSPLQWTGWISLQSKGLSRVFSNTTVQKHQFLGSWEICMQVRKQRLELDMEKQTGSK